MPNYRVSLEKALVFSKCCILRILIYQGVVNVTVSHW